MGQGKEGISTALQFFGKGCNKLIIKPLDGHSGQGVQIIDTLDISEKKLLEMYEKLGTFIVEELIVQDSEMSKLHPASINTVRVATVKTSEGSKIFGCALRMGRGGRHVDNAGAGGIYAVVDPEYGVVVSKAIDNNGNEFVAHPDTDVILPGFQLPHWDSAMRTIRELCDVLPDAGLIAWDLALSDKGWCLVEANDIGEQYLLQGPIGRGIKPKLISLLDKSKTINI